MQLIRKYALKGNFYQELSEMSKNQMALAVSSAVTDAGNHWSNSQILETNTFEPRIPQLLKFLVKENS